MGINTVESSFYKELCNIIDKDRILTDEAMDRHTTFRVGGPAEYFVEVKDGNEIASVIALAKANNRKYYILGNGSNLLVGDGGYDGVIISTHRYMTSVAVEGNTITADAGALLSTVAGTALKASLTGLEFAAGIPGTIGGAVVMNAGAYGGEMKQVLSKVWAVDENGEIKEFSNEELQLGYRTSVFKTRELVCIKAEITLSVGDGAAIKARMDELNAQRREKQPLEYPSAGSTFKRPEGYFAGKLIQDAGLRGFSIGGAMVSEKHCGFVINAGGATASDVYTLMNEVSKRVNEQFGVTLEPEVCMIGRF